MWGASDFNHVMRHAFYFYLTLPEKAVTHIGNYLKKSHAASLLGAFFHTVISIQHIVQVHISIYNHHH